MAADPYVSPTPLPTAKEREVAIILIEECIEVGDELTAIQSQLNAVGKRATKLLRFGFEEIQPGQTLTNKERLSHEVGDLLEVIDLAIQQKLLDPTMIQQGRWHKRDQLAKFLQHRDE